ncbi:pirin family protein [Planctomycetota bacterium]|jgi:redox-sensitive bicupin YhaK (pirin superfamily)|nr:pirin family protein [Planctomycetota bacterium]
MITLRRSADRGHADHGWLDARHTFSFASYFDPEFMQWGSLRVLNQDRIQGGGGFPRHPHQDMEIVTVVLEGELRHEDSMGNGSVIRPGDVQYMSAGTGVTHSEFNASENEPLHLLQMWVVPARPGGEPRYDQRHITPAERQGRLALAAGPASETSPAPITIGQDARLLLGTFDASEAADLPLSGRRAWVHVASGAVRVNGHDLGPGDGAGLVNEAELRIEGLERAEVVVWDLAP